MGGKMAPSVNSMWHEWNWWIWYHCIRLLVYISRQENVW